MHDAPRQPFASLRLKAIIVSIGVIVSVSVLYTWLTIHMQDASLEQSVAYNKARNQTQIRSQINNLLERAVTIGDHIHSLEDYLGSELDVDERLLGALLGRLLDIDGIAISSRGKWSVPGDITPPEPADLATYGALIKQVANSGKPVGRVVCDDTCFHVSAVPLSSVRHPDRYLLVRQTLTQLLISFEQNTLSRIGIVTRHGQTDVGGGAAFAIVAFTDYANSSTILDDLLSDPDRRQELLQQQIVQFRHKGVYYGAYFFAALTPDNDTFFVSLDDISEDVRQNRIMLLRLIAIGAISLVLIAALAMRRYLKTTRHFSDIGHTLPLLAAGRYLPFREAIGELGKKHRKWYRDETDELLHDLVVTADNLERLDTETAQQRMFTDDMLDTMPAVVVLHRTDGTVVRANNMARQVMGISGDGDDRLAGSRITDTQGRSVLEKAWQHDNGLYRQQVKLRLPGGHKGEYSFVHKHLDNCLGDRDCMLSIGLDISEKVKAELVSEAKTQFLATVNHEIRTPLHTIIGNVEQLADSELTDNQIRRLRGIRLASAHLNELIGNVLDFSVIESGREMILNRQIVDLHDSVQNVVEPLRTQARRKGLQLNCRFDCDVPYLVETDRLRFGQILRNLASNAVKYTQEGTIDIHLSAFAHTGDKVGLRLTVRDTGIGIPQDALDSQLGKAYYRVDSPAHRSTYGTGIGLYIVNAIVAAMQGDMHVSSRLGDGSVFKVELPFAVARERRTSGRTFDALGKHSNMIVHYGDGEDSDIRFLRDYLSEHGLPVMVTPRRGFNDALQQVRAGASVHVNCFVTGDREKHSGIGIVHECCNPDDPVDMTFFRVTTSVSTVDAQGAWGTMYSLLPLGDDADIRKRHLFNALHWCAAQANSSALNAPVPQHENASRVSMLIADDNIENLELLEAALKRGGYQRIERATDGNTALRILQGTPIDVAIIDNRMPGLNGIEVATRFREGRHDGEGPIFVLHTADATTELRNESLAAGIHHFLTKPVDSRRLLTELTHIVDGRTPMPVPGTPYDESDNSEAVDDNILNDVLAGFGSSADALNLYDTTVARYIADDTRQLRSSLGGEDTSEARNILHKMRGSLLAIGFSHAGELCRQIEQLDDDSLRDEGEDHIPQLVAAIRHAHGDIRRRLSG